MPIKPINHPTSQIKRIIELTCQITSIDKLNKCTICLPPLPKTTCKSQPPSCGEGNHHRSLELYYDLPISKSNLGIRDSLFHITLMCQRILLPLFFFFFFWVSWLKSIFKRGGIYIEKCILVKFSCFKRNYYFSIMHLMALTYQTCTQY